MEAIADSESPEESLANLLQVLNGSTTKSLENLNSSGIGIMVLNITLQRQSSVQYQRRLIMEFEWFLGCIGGILALFTGVSLLSMTQTIYSYAVSCHKDRVAKKKWDKIKADAERRRANSDPNLRYENYDFQS